MGKRQAQGDGRGILTAHGDADGMATDGSVRRPKVRAAPEPRCMGVDYRDSSVDGGGETGHRYTSSSVGRPVETWNVIPGLDILCYLCYTQHFVKTCAVLAFMTRSRAALEYPEAPLFGVHISRVFLHGDEICTRPLVARGIVAVGRLVGFLSPPQHPAVVRLTEARWPSRSWVRAVSAGWSRAWDPSC